VEVYELSLAFVIGFLVGVILYPNFEPIKFRKPLRLQLFLGAVSGFFLGLLFKVEYELLPMCVIIGLSCGFFVNVCRPK